MDDLIKILTSQYVIIGLILVLFIIIIILISRRMQVKKQMNYMKELEVSYNSIKSIPLSFKLNKAVALARVNEDVNKLLPEFQTDFDLVTSNIKQIAQLLGDCEDALATGQIKAAKLMISDIEGMLETGEKQSKALDTSLDNVLEEETEQRTQINDCKDRFREVKHILTTQQAQYAFSMETIEEKVGEIEKLFTTFEEWMFASEFDKAKMSLESINVELLFIEAVLKLLPNLLASARGIVPKQIDEVSQAYSYAKQKGVFLQHLEITKNLEVISETLKEDLAKIRKCEVEEVNVHLEEDQKRLLQLLQQIEREDKAFDEMKNEVSLVKKHLEDTQNDMIYCSQAYDKTAERFDFIDMGGTLKTIEKKLIQYAETYNKLEKMIEVNTIPASTVLMSIKEFSQELTATSMELNGIKTKLDSVRSDEERAKKQLLKLHLIMNEIQVKIRKHRLPTISTNYEGDVKKSYEHIHRIEDLLEHTPLNVNLLNASLSDAIDYIYKLYNNVNNIVGMALMVENAIVFGNKYRSTFADIDSELTRAELAFRNGEYTQALTIAIAAIEKIHPGSCEKLIKENAASAV